uniref:Vesicle transport protein n=1 Tax=Plectus sambesii TaxID=2011161 RepID=A0A914VDI3_9BILA
MASTSLQDFVKEQKTKTHSPSVQSLASFQSGFTDFRSKLSSSLSSFELPLIGRSKNDVAVDFETSSTNGQLPASQNRKNAQSGWMGGLLTSDDAFGLTRTQRVLGFFMCLLSGVFCFGLATLFLPVVVLQARKFAALNTLGSCFLIFSFALLWGPRSYIAHLFSSPRIPVTASYFVSVLGTLYCALWVLTPPKPKSGIILDWND